MKYLPLQVFGTNEVVSSHDAAGSFQYNIVNPI